MGTEFDAKYQMPRPKADYQLQHILRWWSEASGGKVWLIYLSICRRQQKANDATNAQNIPKGNACEWHKEGSPMQKLQLLTELNLHEFSFCCLVVLPLSYKRLSQDRILVLIASRHCHLRAALTRIPYVQARLCNIYSFLCYFFSGQDMCKYIFGRLEAVEELGVMMTTVHLKVICFDCVH